MKARNVAWDYAKGMGILIVVFAHLWRGLGSAGLLKSVDPALVAGISSACTVLSMPVFFLVSGLLYGGAMARRHGAREFGGKVDAIFYPYLVWSLIIGLSEVLTSGVRNGRTSMADLIDILWNPHGIFWFLYALLLAFAVLELMIFALGVGWARLLALPLGLILLGLYPCMPKIFCLPELAMSFVYFTLGIAFANIVPKKQYVSWPLVIASIAALIALQYIAHQSGWGTRSMRSVTPNAFPLALASLVLMMSLCHALPAKGLSMVAMLGERSMDVYLVHLLFVAASRIFLHKMLSVDSIWLYLLVGMWAGVWGSLTLVRLMKKRRALSCLFQPPAFLSIKNRLDIPSAAATA